MTQMKRHIDLKMKNLHTFLLCMIIISADVAEPLHLKGKLSGGQDIITLNDTFYKYVASLFSHGTLYCSAVVVSLKNLLTTASCLENLIVSQNLTEFAYHFALIASDKENRSLPQYYFLQVEAHPQYDFKDPQPYLNVGLITLLVKIELDTKFFPLDWEPKNGKYRSSAIIPGWEITYDRNCTHTIIPYLNLKYVIVTTKSSSNIPDGYYSKDWVLRQKTFLGTTPSDKYLENVDVGAPVLSKIRSKIKGIVSFVPEDKSIPVIILKTHVFKEWVERAKLDKPFEKRPRQLLTQPLTDLETLTPLAGSPLTSPEAD